MLAAFLLSACACGLPVGERQRLEARLAAAGFVHLRFAASGEALTLPVHAWLRRREGDLLTVAIEGDGAAWFNPRWPPADPTPEYSQAAALAEALPGSVAYLARPCQFEPVPPCRLEHWTTRRFAPELVAALDGALDRLKREAGATRLRLVGHSGGGVMAVLLAHRRQDVVAVVTLMAPLDLAEWVQQEGLTPLIGEGPEQLPPLSIPQRHVAGGKDRIVPAAIVRRYVGEKGGQYVEWRKADHACWPVADAVRLIEEMR